MVYLFNKVSAKFEHLVCVMLELFPKFCSVDSVSGYVVHEWLQIFEELLKMVDKVLGVLRCWVGKTPNSFFKQEGTDR